MAADEIVLRLLGKEDKSDFAEHLKLKGVATMTLRLNYFSSFKASSIPKLLLIYSKLHIILIANSYYGR